MKSHENINVYINLFVHYPETYNANTINNNFNIFFMECINSDVMINSAPHNEEESIKIEVYIKGTNIDKENFILKCNKFVLNYFNNKLKDINVIFID